MWLTYYRRLKLTESPLIQILVGRDAILRPTVIVDRHRPSVPVYAYITLNSFWTMSMKEIKPKKIWYKK